jgi:GcrA cell cycle regulator
MSNRPWSPELTERLAALWADGLSASQIAAELGNVTRNAVIGKVDRLGLPGRPKPASFANARPRRRKPSNLMSKNDIKMLEKPAAFKARPRAVPPTEPKPRNKTLMQLRPRECKWPYGTGPYVFCANRAEPGRRPYCAYHEDAAHRPPGAESEAAE